MSRRLFTGNMKLADMVNANHNLILLMPRFGLPLGFGNRSVKEICEANNINTDFFLLICNIHTFDDYLPGDSMNEELIELVFDILQLTEDLEKHTIIEERLLMPADDYELSEREKQVLVLVAKGLSSKEIADKLCLSIHTVNSHRKNISQKTGIKSAAGLAAYAMICKLN